MIEYRGALTEDDHVRAVSLGGGLVPSPGGANSRVLVFGLGFCILAVWGYFGGDEPNPGALWWFALAAPCFFVLWYQRSATRRQWRQSPELRSEYFGRVTDEALETHLGTNARLPWQLFSAQAISPTVVVLFLGSTYIPLAKGFFKTEADWQAVVAIIQEKVTRGPRRSSTIRLLVLWLVALAVIFLAWHFAQIPRAP